jgi:hypothetical protein
MASADVIDPKAAAIAEYARLMLQHKVRHRPIRAPQPEHPRAQP